MGRLISERLITTPFPEEVPDIEEHSGEPYCFYTRRLCIGPEQGNIREVENFTVYCIQNWGKSPFVKINPNRTALVGRRLFLKIKPSVLLNFTTQKTEIY